MWTALCSLDNFQFDHNKRQVKILYFCTQNITPMGRRLLQYYVAYIILVSTYNSSYHIYKTCNHLYKRYLSQYKTLLRIYNTSSQI